MARGVFIIEELRRAGGLSVGTKDQAERFEWSSDSKPSNPVRGGARACPLQVWAQPGEQRIVRTDYPGARTPSFQILGPVHKPNQFSGRWDDRYNFAGYATQEKARFEALCRRGNPVRIQFGQEVIEGIIVNWEFPWRREWDISYTFTVEVSDRPASQDIGDRSPATVLSSSELFDGSELATAAMQEAQETAPRAVLSTSTALDTEANIASASARLDELGATLDQREIFPDERPTDPFTRLATQFRLVAAAAFYVNTGLYEVRHDTDLAIYTAMSVLNFEDWSRSIRFTGRVLLGRSLEGGSQVAERADPAAARLYRPFDGESLYAVSRRFYGTPHAWRLIAERNGLTTINLTGDEILVIPERGMG